MSINFSVKDVERVCMTELKKLGYQTTAPIAYYQLTDVIYGWIGLNIVKHPNFVRINASIGVHCVPVMRCFDHSRGRSHRKGRIATYSVPIGAVVPTEREIIVTDVAEIDSEVNRLMTYISGPVHAYIKRFADLGVLTNALVDRVGELGGNPEKYALMLLLQKRQKEFLDFSIEHSIRLLAFENHELIASWDDFKLKALKCMLDV